MVTPSARTAIFVVVLSALVQCTLAARSVLPALDAVRFVAQAQEAERQGFLAFVVNADDPPLFPWLISVFHSTAHASGIDVSWQAAAQSTACLLMIFASLPALALMTATMGRRTGVLGALLFCCFAPIARLGADGLSETAALVFVASGLWASVRFFAATSRVAPFWTAVAAVCFLFAWLARWETIVIAGCFAIAVAVMLVRQWRFTVSNNRLSIARYTLSLCFFLLFLGLPVSLVAAGRTNESWQVALCELVQGRTARETSPLNATPEILLAEAAATPVLAFADGGEMVFGRKDHSTSTRASGTVAKVREFAHEIAHAFGIVLSPLVLFGLWSHRPLLRSDAHRFLTGVALACFLMLIGLVSSTGYLSSRHFLVLQLLAIPWAAAGILAINEWLGRMSPRFPARLAPVACAVMIAAPSFWQPLHQSQLAHRRAAEWLAPRVDDGTVLDTFGYTALTSRAPTYRGELALAAFYDPRLEFIVLESRELKANSARGKSFREVLAAAGEFAKQFDNVSSPDNPVLVFRWRPSRWRESAFAAPRGMNLPQPMTASHSSTIKE